MDALAKLFGVRVTFADLQRENGYYDRATREIVLDVAPVHRRSKNVFLFTIAHEIGHAVKDRLTAEQWKSFERVAVKTMGGEKAVTAKQHSNEAYADRAVAGEEVACDFIGELLSDKSTLNAFCDTIRSGALDQKNARGFVATVRKIIGKLTGRGESKTNTQAEALVEKVREQFAVDLQTAQEAVQAMQRALSAALEEEKQGNVLTGEQSFGYSGEGIRYSSKYWHPKLNQSEWSLLNRKMDEGIQSGRTS